MSRLSQELIEQARAFSDAVGLLGFSAPVSHVYNPLVYARRAHEAYLERYGSTRKEVVFLGMNPGPYGMTQTGVPFGDVVTVRDWLRLDAPIERPPAEHPKRPVLGLGCSRVEVSGARLWGWARERFGTPERFFARFFVANYCPLVFLEAGGRNRTPDKLPVKERVALESVCDEALRRSMILLKPELVVGVGAFARSSAERSLVGTGIRVGQVLHPSPANPRANQGWAAQMERQLGELGVTL